MCRSPKTLLAVLLLAGAILPPTFQASARTSIRSDMSTQALASRSAFFYQSKTLRGSPTLQALKWSLALLRIGVDRGTSSYSVLNLTPDPDSRRFLMMEDRKEAFLLEGLFAKPQRITWHDKDGDHRMWIRLSFAGDTEEDHDAIRETLLRPELEFARKGRLPQNHADLVRMLGDAAHREEFLALTDPILTRNPLKIIARNVITGKVLGFVYPVFIRAKDAEQLPNTWLGMSEWLNTYEPKPKDLGQWVMGDIWFTGGGNGAVATAMLDASYELGRAMGISRFFAYSNPRALPMYWEKYPERREDLHADQYAARIIAPLIMERLKVMVEKKQIRTWKDFDRQVQRYLRRHTQGRATLEVSGPLSLAIWDQKAALDLPEKPHAGDFYKLIEALSLPFEQGGYAINDPAITFHLKRGSKLSRIIPDAFPEILGGPGIGGGFSFVMEYSVQLRHRFLSRFGEQFGVQVGRYQRYRLLQRKMEWRRGIERAA